MAIELMDEHEQGEQVRAWLRENASAILGGIVLGLAGIFGWQWWGAHTASHRLDAATQYQALTEAVERNDRDAVEALHASLVGEFTDTPYAALAGLRLAEQKLAAGETVAAVEVLGQAVAHSRDPALEALVRVRMARAQLANGDAAAALASLDRLPAGSYAAVADELRGDALLVLGRREDARAAFTAALAASDPLAPGRRILELKLADLGGTNVLPEAEA